MAYEYDPTLDFDAQEQAMLQQAARIKALRGMKASDIEQPEGFRSAVTGTMVSAPRVRKRALSYAVPLLAEATADRQEGELTKARSDMSAAQQKELADWIARTPQGIPAVPETPETYGAGEEGPTMTPGVPAQAAVPPTRQEVLSHAQAGFKNPLAKALAQQYLGDQLIKEPEREEARAERKFLKAQAAAEARLRQEQELEYRRERDRQAAELRRDLANQSAATRLALKSAVGAATAGDKPSKYQLFKDPETGVVTKVNKLTDEITVVGPGATPKPQAKLPTAEQAKYSTNKAAISSIDAVLGDKENRGATGLVKGTLIKAAPVLGTKLVNAWGSMGEQDRRSAINRLTGIEVHRLYGAAQTLGEVARAGGFLPEPTDDADTIDSKLKQMKASIERENRAIEEMAKAQNYKSPGAPQGGASGDWAIEEVK